MRLEAIRLNGNCDGTSCSVAAPADADSDSVPDASDNCPLVSNPLPDNRDGDRYGDACDQCRNDSSNDQGSPTDNDPATWPDADNDGVCDSADNCMTDWNPYQSDRDDDGEGDECEDDIDGDGLVDDVSIAGTYDTCRFVRNPGSSKAHPVAHSDADADGIGDDCDCHDDRTGPGDPGTMVLLLEDCQQARRFFRDEQRGINAMVAAYRGLNIADRLLEYLEGCVTPGCAPPEQQLVDAAIGYVQSFPRDEFDVDYLMGFIYELSPPEHSIELVRRYLEYLLEGDGRFLLEDL